MSSSSSTAKQQQQQQSRRLNTNNTTQHSRNTNAYFDRDEYHRPSNSNYRETNKDFYLQHRNIYSMRKERPIINEQRYHNKSNNIPSYYHHHHHHIPPRHREQHLSRFPESKINNKQEEIKSLIKPLQSASSSSINSDISNNAGSTNRKDLHAKNLAAAAQAARQQNAQPLSMVQTLMNSLILQQQQQQSSSSSQSSSTVQLQYQLTNALLATMIQQRLKETALQAQAQQIQAAIPTLLAAQALAYQQSGQLTPSPQPFNVAHPGTKFNNRPLVKFAPVVRPPMMMPVIRPSVTTNGSRHRLGTNTQQTNSTTVLPTYQQVQEIERGISLDEAIHFKGAINITDADKNSIVEEKDVTPKQDD